MGQMRTALFWGAEINDAVHAFWNRDSAESNALFERHYDQGLRRFSDDVVGFPFAVAYDPPKDCVELALPVCLGVVAGSIAGDIGPKVGAKWAAFVTDLAQAGVVFDEEPDIFLGEIERA